MGIENVKFGWKGSVELDGSDVIRLVASLREARENMMNEFLALHKEDFPNNPNQYEVLREGTASAIAHCDELMKTLIEKASTTANDTDLENTYE